MGKVAIGYVDMVADLFHYGHVNCLRNAKTKCNYLIVGVHSNECAHTYKRIPILTMEERASVVEACRFVDQVVINAPVIITNDYLDNLKVDKVFHCHSLEDDEKYNYMYKNVLERFERLEYTDTISTTNIINRIKDRYTN